jgi:hypothetical protein
MTLEEALQKLCRELPLGWNVRIEAEEGSAWVELEYDGRYMDWDDGDYPDHSISERMMLALEYAKEHNKYVE